MKHWLFIFALWGILAGVDKTVAAETPEPEHYLLEPPVVEEVEEIEEEIKEEVTEILNDEENEYFSTISKIELVEEGIEDTEYAFVKENNFYVIMLKKAPAGNMSSSLRAIDMTTGKSVGKDVKLNGDFTDAKVLAVKSCENGDYIAVVESKDSGLAELFIERLSSSGKLLLKTDLAEVADTNLDSETFKGLSIGEDYSYVAVGGQVLVLDENLELERQIILSHALGVSVDSEDLAYFIECGDGALYAYNPSINRIMDEMPKIEGGNAVFGGGKDEVFVTDGNAFYVCDRLYKTVKKLFDLGDVDICAASFNDVYKDSEGNYNFVFDTVTGRDYLKTECVTDVYYIAKVTGVSTTEYTGEYSVEIEDYKGGEDAARIFSFVEDGLLYLVKTAEVKGEYTEILSVRDALTGESIGKDVNLTMDSKTLVASKITPAGSKGFVLVGFDYKNDDALDVVARLDADGKLIVEKKLDEIKGLVADDILVTAIQSDGNNTYISYIPTSGDESFMSRTAMLDKDLNFVMNLGENASYVCIGSDNLVYFLDTYNECLSAYDPATGKLKEDLASFKYAESMYRGAKGELFIGEYESLSRYDLETGKVYKLLDYKEIGIYTYYIESVFRSGDGSIHIIYDDYADNGGKTKIAHVKPVEVNPLNLVAKKVKKAADDKGAYYVTEEKIGDRNALSATASLIGVSDGYMFERVTIESDNDGKKTYNDYFRCIDLATGTIQGRDVPVTDDVINYNFFNMFRTEDGGLICIGDAYIGLDNYDCIVRLSADGKVLKKANLTELFKSFGNYQMTAGVTSNGVYTCIPVQSDTASGYYGMILCLDENFVMKKVLIKSQNVGVAFGSDDLIYILDGINGGLHCYDPKSDTIIDLEASLGDCFGIHAGGQGELLIEGDEDTILSYRPQDGTVTKLVDYKKALEIDSYHIVALSRDAYGAIHMFYIPRDGSSDYKLAHIVRSIK